MRFLFFLGPLCEGAPPAGGGGELLVLESTDRQHRMTLPHVLTHDGQGHILQNPAPELTACRGAAVALPDGAEQAVDVCFDLTAAPAGDFSLTFDGGLTLAYADAARVGL